MKLITSILAIAAITSAIVVPGQQMMEQVAIENRDQSYFDEIKISVEETWSKVEGSFKDTIASGGNTLDTAINGATDAAAANFGCHDSLTSSDLQGWFHSDFESIDDLVMEDISDRLPSKDPPHFPEPTQTIYQIIISSQSTSKLASYINEYPDLVNILNGTASNYTLFAPIDSAWERLPHRPDNPWEDLIHALLTYHIIPPFSLESVFYARTIPTLHLEEGLGGRAQRIRVGFGLGGLKLNFNCKITAGNIRATNGWIHTVDTPILFPPSTAKLLPKLPAPQFSTLQHMLQKTGLDKVLIEPRTGGTFFAPTNKAFQKLGVQVNDYLMSDDGVELLKKVLEYHIVVNRTMYSDGYMSIVDDSKAEEKEREGEVKWPRAGPDGTFHVVLPTLLKGRSVSVDVRRWGRFMRVRINGFTGVEILDVIAGDGVIQVLPELLIPQMPLGEVDDDGEMSVEEFKARFEGYSGREEL